MERYSGILAGTLAEVGEDSCDYHDNEFCQIQGGRGVVLYVPAQVRGYSEGCRCHLQAE